MDSAYYPTSGPSAPSQSNTANSARFSLTPAAASPSTSTKPSTTAGRIASATGLYSTTSTAAPAPLAGILDRPLNKGKGAEVSLSAFAFLLAEVVSYSQSRVDSVTDLERRCVSVSAGSAGLTGGQIIVLRLRSWSADLVAYSATQYAAGWGESESYPARGCVVRSGYNAEAHHQDPKREHRLIPILQFVHTQVYKYCFGKPADGLERSVEGEDECGLFSDPAWQSSPTTRRTG
jgi:hypothetical protein